MPDPDVVPRGLVLFSPSTPPARRRQRLLFVVFLIVAAVALVWPVYALVAQPFPLILGLPQSLAWTVGWLALMMAALFWLYRSE